MTAKKKAKPDTRMIGDAGEYYVAYRLAKMGITSAIVSRGSRSVDIMCTRDGSRSMSIQVKTTCDRKDYKRWYLGETEFEPSESFCFAFVIIRPDKPKSKEEPPEVFVVPSRRVREITDDEKDPKAKRPRFHLSDEDAKPFQDNWHPVKKYLGVD